MAVGVGFGDGRSWSLGVGKPAVAISSPSGFESAITRG